MSTKRGYFRRLSEKRLGIAWASVSAVVFTIDGAVKHGYYLFFESGKKPQHGNCMLSLVLRWCR